MIIIMKAILFKRDLDNFSDHDILTMAKMYDLSGRIDDIRWLIAIKHAQKAQMLSGNVMFFVEKIPQLQTVAEKRNDTSFPDIDKSYIQDLLRLIKDQKQSKRLPKNQRQAVLDDLRKREEILQTDENWHKIQELREKFNVTQQLFDWVLKYYLSGDINKIEDISSRLKPSIDDFNWLKKHNIIDKKIQQLNGLRELEDFLDQYKEQLKEVQGELTEIEKGRKGGELIYDGKDIKIIQPTTVAGACYYGRGTRWCTAATKSDNMFETYDVDGPLYIIQPKRPDREGKEKYQLQFETNTFADEKDNIIDLNDLIKKYPEIIALRKYNPNVLKSLYGDGSLKEFLRAIKATPINTDEINAFFKGLQTPNKQILNYLADNFEIQNNIEYPPIKLLRFLEQKNMLDRVIKLRLNKRFKYDIPQFTNLIELYAPGYNLSQESLEHIFGLKNLQVLNLNDNQLQNLPESIGNLDNLQKLYLDKNLLGDLPESLWDLNNLQILFVGYNRLQKLSDSIGRLNNLEILFLGNNYLREIPESIGDLKNLKELYLQNNKLVLIPDTISKLNKLTMLNLKGNNIKKGQISQMLSNVLIL